MLAEKIIRKHVAIIHAYSLMSVLQRKIVNVLLYEAVKGSNRVNNQESVAIECCIPFSNLCKEIKFNSNNTQYLKEAIDGLASLKIEWNLLKDKVPTDISFLNLRILHGSPTFYQDNTLNFSFHKIMLDLVENPSIYGTLDIDLQCEFESKYSHALYENSTRFINLQKNKIILLEAFRKIVGVQQDKYPNIRELTRNVITPSIEEVNDRAPFVVSLEAIKSGRKITAFELVVKNKKKTVMVDTKLDICESRVIREINLIFGTLSETVLENILNSYSEEYILEKISYTKQCAKKENSGYYPIPYFISALKHNYKFKETSSQQQDTQLPDEKTKWEHELNFLQSDINHWEDRLEYFKLIGDETQVRNVENILLKCQEKIKKHSLRQPIQTEAV